MKVKWSNPALESLVGDSVGYKILGYLLKQSFDFDKFFGLFMDSYYVCHNGFL